MLIGQGVPVFERLRVSPACPLILSSHVALDRAREKAQGANAIGTTGRGIGPAYEDKVARRALRVSDLFHRERFAAKLGEILDYHNFILQRYFQVPAIDFQQVLESNLELGERLKPLVADVTGILEQLSVDGRNVLFEGAQGAMLDVDLGTYPFVTSSTTTAGGAAAGTGLGPRRLHEVLGHRQGLCHPRRCGSLSHRAIRRVRRAFVARGSRVRFGDRPAPALRMVRCGRSAPLHRAQQLLLAVRHQARCARRTGHDPRLRRVQSRRRHQYDAAPAVGTFWRIARRCTRTCPDGRTARWVSRATRSCRPMRAATSNDCSPWWACPSPSFPRDRIGIKPSFARIHSADARDALKSML